MSVILRPLVSPHQLHYKLDKQRGFVGQWTGLVWKCTGTGGTAVASLSSALLLLHVQGENELDGPEGQIIGSWSKCLMMLFVFVAELSLSCHSLSAGPSPGTQSAGYLSFYFT